MVHGTCDGRRIIWYWFRYSFLSKVRSHFMQDRSLWRLSTTWIFSVYWAFCSQVILLHVQMAFILETLNHSTLCSNRDIKFCRFASFVRLTNVWIIYDLCNVLRYSGRDSVIVLILRNGMSWSTFGMQIARFCWIHQQRFFAVQWMSVACAFTLNTHNDRKLFLRNKAELCCNPSGSDGAMQEYFAFGAVGFPVGGPAHYVLCCVRWEVWMHRDPLTLSKHFLSRLPSGTRCSRAAVQISPLDPMRRWQQNLHSGWPRFFELQRV